MYPRFVNIQNISDMNTIRNYFAVENQILPVSAYANQDENLETERAESESFLMHRSHVATSLSHFAANVTDNVWITSWHVSRGSHSVQGYSITPEDLSELLTVLEKEWNLVNVRLKTTEKTTWKNHQVIRFSLSAEDVR